MNHHPEGPCDQCDLAVDEMTGDWIVWCKANDVATQSKNNNITEESL